MSGSNSDIASKLEKREGEENSPEQKRMRKTEDSNGEEVLVPMQEEVTEQEQIAYYLASALENIGENDARALDLIKITINEADKLLHEFNETEPQRFDATFYLALACALYHFSSMEYQDQPEELEFLTLAEEKINRCKEVLTEKDDIKYEAHLTHIKILLSKARIILKSKEEMEIEDEEDEKNEGENSNDKLDESAYIGEAISLLDLLSKDYEKILSNQEGQFSNLINDYKNSIEFIQDYGDSQDFWLPRKKWNLWAKEKYEQILRIGENDMEASLGVSNCLISMTNLYLEKLSNEDEDEDEEEDEEEDDEEYDPDLKAEMNNNVAMENLSQALELLKKSIERVKQDESYNDQSLAQIYTFLIEVYINLGNLSADEKQANEYHMEAVEAVKAYKQLNCEDLLPERFEHVIEGLEADLNEDSDENENENK
ncbi:hypothetical protein K502DRAFT_346596 [Neoconidiobolus thromboides FSU 785]|nr:hypothetical protein K502DRAFT_346596 [Neoconidiobolus thromboides FSU 785]